VQFSASIYCKECQFAFDDSSIVRGALKMESFDKLPNALVEMIVVLGLDETSALDSLVNM